MPKVTPRTELEIANRDMKEAMNKRRIAVKKVEKEVANFIIKEARKNKILLEDFDKIGKAIKLISLANDEEIEQFFKLLEKK